MFLSLPETKSVAIATYHQDGGLVTLWKYTPEDSFQGGKTICWLQSHNPIKSGWETKQISSEEAAGIWLKHGWTCRKIYVPHHQPMQSRSGLIETEPNVFVEAAS